MKRLLLALLLASGCSAKTSPPSPAASATSEPAPTAAAIATAAPTATAAPAPAAGECDLRWGYHGNVAGQDAYLRLQRSGHVGGDPKTPGPAGDTLAGRYFYARIGVDIALAGTIDAAGAIQLVEGDPRKPTGRFKGTCGKEPGVIEGTWTDDKREQPFRFERVGPRPIPLTPTKKLKVSRRVPRGKGLSPTECKYEQKVFEIFGAGTPDAERALNQQDATTLKPAIRHKEMHDDVVRCENGLEADFYAEVVATFGGLVTIVSGGSFSAENAAHPGNFVSWSRKTYDLGTGKPITEKDLFAKFPKPLVDRCLAAYEKMPNGAPNIEADGHIFALTPKGVHVFHDSYGHAAGALTGRGPILTWAALLREGALRPDSPAKRAWEGVAPAKAGDPECLSDDESPPPTHQH